MNPRYVDEHEKNNELVRTKTNSGGVSSYRVRCVRCYFFSYQIIEYTEKSGTLCAQLSRFENSSLISRTHKLLVPCKIPFRCFRGRSFPGNSSLADLFFRYFQVQQTCGNIDLNCIAI